MWTIVGWLVLHCHVPQDVAAEAIERAGYETYNPHYRARLAGVRIDATGRRIRTRGLGSIVERVLLPGYILIAWHPDLRERPLRLAAGESRILRYSLDADGQARPKLLSPDRVDELRTRVDAGDFDEIGRRASGKAARWTPIAELLRQWHDVAGVAGVAAE
jgi:hypothetical protein